MINLTQNAAQQALKIMTDNQINTSNAGVKVGVKAGGCSGLNYILDIVESPDENDRVYVQNGVRIFVDPKSYLYLDGTEVDYESTMTGGGFKFQNPNAKRSCGCGTSFAV